MRAFFIKTMNEEAYLHSFLKEGEMFFRHVDEFRQIEDGNVRGDKKEGMQKEIMNISIAPSVSTFYIGGNGGKTYGVDWEGFKKAHPEVANVTAPFTFLISYVANSLLYCITYINSNTQNIDAVLSEIQKFGKYSAVVTDCEDFIAKLRTRIPNSDFGLVRYGSKKDDSKSLSTYSIFDKSIEYELQQEFRISKPANGQKQEIVKIGKLSGFVCTSRSLDVLKQQL